MDLVGYARVLRRQSRLLVLGLALTFIVTAAALLRVSADGVEWRSKPTYAGSSTLLVTQPGFPYGRSVTEGTGTRPGRFADPLRMEYLAGLYAELAKSESVLAIIGRKGKLQADTFSVSQLTGPGGRTLPLIEVIGVSPSKRQALTIANRVATGLRQYILENQNQNRVPEANRVALPVVTRAERAQVFEGRQLTKPIMLLLLGSVLTLVLVFGRDNVQRYREEADAHELAVLQQTPPATVVDLEVGREQAPGPAGEPRRRAGPAQER